MLSRTDELEVFKIRISLAEYATSCGYIHDRRASSRNSAVMAHPDGDKIVLAVGKDRHWMYFSVRADNDHGSIIDFVQRRQGGRLGDVRKPLRAFLDSPAPLQAEGLPVLEPASTDLICVRSRFEAMNLILGRHCYLEEERRIPTAVLSHPRFSGRIRIDERGNAIFPHWNLSGFSAF